ncbi:hypothetical protein Trydic_g11101 [Trypoxylus dichotomus]
MTDVQVNIPGNKSSLLANNYAVVTMCALNDHALHSPDLIRYSIVKVGEELLDIYPPTGDILFTSNFLNDTIRNITSIEVEVYAEDRSGRDNTTFQVNVTPPDILDCDLIIQDLCYWQSATYRIYENRKASAIGSISSPYLAEMCKGYNITYEITEGDTHFALAPPAWGRTWGLQTIRPLNRDVTPGQRQDQRSYGTGQSIVVGVDCNIINPKGTERIVSKNITVNVLDEDDNAPYTGESSPVQIILDKHFVIKGQALQFPRRYQIFYDDDSPEVNKYDIQLLNDTENILQKNCSVTLDDRQNRTVVLCGVFFNKKTRLPTSPYRFIIQVNDTSLLKGYGNSVARQVVDIIVSKRAKPTLQTMSYVKDDNLPPLLIYPAREVEIFRTAAPYARVIQPDRRNRDDATSFRIARNRNNKNKALDITKSEGIVYVNNIDGLKDVDLIILVIEWKRYNATESDEVHIRIINETIDICSNKTSHVNDWVHCGIFDNAKECERECGLATGGAPNVKRRSVSSKENRCVWLNTKAKNSPGYFTCSPDPVTCPDKECDSLEQKERLICPQDCSENSIFAPRNIETGRGIGNGFGVCTCDVSGSCICSNRSKSSTPIPNVTGPIGTNVTATASPAVGRHTGNEIATCGTTCMLGIIAGIVFLLGAVGVVVICWRLDRVQKAVRGKFTEDVQDLSAPLSDYVDRAVLPDTLHLNFDMIMLNNHESKLATDPKWEFPRNQLIIEQTLGEGEFGRVLRARAKDIAGQSGYTTVAVKTLKEDAREGELNDLLSEYELLKEVSHPNVIRLLGASTMPGGPVYLIIEFAQYGSLRSYLRRSRQIKTECHPQLTAVSEDCDAQHGYDHPNSSKVTPKDILSFAWQISNGMSYLSDVKLVHRDLAARNVLLAAGKICKISDFGLTRDIYEDDAYFKRSKGRVPVKWMAPESLSDHVYTSKSDVWSFGVLIWELVTLGATPYPGVPVQNLFHLLRQGYRMERPENCSPALYKVMRSCWHIDPTARPEFSDLAVKFEKMLSDGVEYLDLSTNVIHNRSYFCMNFDEEENEPLTTTNNNKELLSSINYLEKLQPYVKCGDSDKVLEPVMDNTLKVENETVSVLAQGYESPIKFENKSSRPKTPSNESPQYYTDMAQQNKNMEVQ